MRREDLEALWKDLQAQHGVTVAFYPGINLEDLPQGYLTELKGICHTLAERGIQCSAKNIFSVMAARRELMRIIRKHRQVREGIEGIARGRVGITGDPVYDLVIILTPLVLFGKGFFTRMGERLADRILNYFVDEVGFTQKEAATLSELLVELNFEERKKLLRFRVRRAKSVRKTRK